MYDATMQRYKRGASWYSKADLWLVGGRDTLEPSPRYSHGVAVNTKHRSRIIIVKINIQNTTDIIKLALHIYTGGTCSVATDEW